MIRRSGKVFHFALLGLLIIIGAVLCAYKVYVFCFRNVRAGVRFIEDKYLLGKEYSEKTEDIENSITYNGERVAYDSSSNTFYIHSSIGSKKLTGKIASTDKNIKLYFKYDEYFNYKDALVRDRYRCQLYMVGDRQYMTADVVFSGMPLIVLDGEKGSVVYDDNAITTIDGDVSLNSSGEVYTLKPDVCCNILGLGVNRTWKIECIVPRDNTFCRAMLAYDVWNYLNSDDALEIKCGFCEVFDGSSYKGLCIIHPEIADTGKVGSGPIYNSEEWFSFLQISYAYQNAKEKNELLQMEDGRTFIIPKRIECAFGAMTDKDNYLSYHYEKKMIDRKDVGIDRLSDAAISKICSYDDYPAEIDKYYSLLNESGFLNSSGVDLDSSIRYDSLKKSIALRMSNIKEYYNSNEVLSEESLNLDMNTDGFKDVFLNVCTDDSNQKLKMFVKDRKAYFFLPAYADLDEVELFSDSFELPTELILGYEYDVLIQEESIRLVFLKSESIAAMYIDTYNNTREYIDSDKKNWEPGSMVCIGKDGKIDSSGIIKKMHAHGSSSFYTEKKSYQINLREDTDVLGMGAGKKWLLISNAFDSTLIRNKLVYDMAEAFGMKYAVDSEFVDLYVNSEYAGNYLVCEKIEVNEERVNIAGGTNSFLVAAESETKSDDTFFMDLLGRAVVVKYPEKVDEETVSLIKERINGIEKTILDSNTDSYIEAEKSIDADSFAIKFFVDFITNEVDSNIKSTYYCFAGEDGKLYAGPCWDYDRAIGNEIGHENRGQYSNYDAYWQGLPEFLFYKDEFYALLQKKYDGIKEYVDGLLEHGIEQYMKLIECSETMNRLVRDEVNDTFFHSDSWENDVLHLEEYLSERMNILDDVMKDKYSWHMVFVNDITGRAYWVKSGESIPENMIQYICRQNECRKLLLDGEEFNESVKINSDLILTLVA